MPAKTFNLIQLCLGTAYTLALPATSWLGVHSQILLHLTQWLTLRLCYIRQSGSLFSIATSRQLVHSCIVLHPSIGLTPYFCYICETGSLSHIATSGYLVQEFLRLLKSLSQSPSLLNPEKGWGSRRERPYSIVPYSRDGLRERYFS